MRYYIADESCQKGFVEVTETEYNALFGDVTIRSYVQAVYRGDVLIEDIPTEYQAAVRIVVANKIDRWGAYKNIEDTQGLTDEVYDDAIDIEGAPYTYEETSSPVETEVVYD